MERRSPILSDWLVAIGWIFALGWVICCAITYRMGALDENPVTTVPLLKVCIGLNLKPARIALSANQRWKVYFASNYFFDIGLYFPKASLLSLYCQVFQVNFKRLRIALYITIVYVTLCWITSFCLDTFWCLPIRNNWYEFPNSDCLMGTLIGFHSRSISKSQGSVWNSWAVFRINYAFNVSSDCIGRFDVPQAYHYSNDGMPSLHSSFLPLALHTLSTPSEMGPGSRLLSRPDHYSHECISLPL